MKTSDILIRAKKFLAAGIDDFEKGSKKTYCICFAVDEAARDRSVITIDECAATKQMISSRLGSYSTLGSWLEGYHKITAVRDTQVGYTEYRNKLQATRHAWLDSMIAEFQAKGD